MTHFHSIFRSILLATILLPTLASNALAQPGDLNCDGSYDVTDVQLMINKALNKPLSPLLDADGNGIHDACPDSLCGAGTVTDDATGLCVVDPLALQTAKDEAFANGVASVDITSDNQDSFDAGIASVDITSDNQDSFDAGVASVDLTVLNLSGIDLSWVDFSDSNLSDWAFVRGVINNADMSNALLVEADLSDVELKNTNFTGADLTDALMGGTDLTGATWTDAICPDGTDANDNGGTCCGHFNGATPWKGCP